MNINKVGPELGDCDYETGPSFGEQQQAIDKAVAEVNRWWSERWTHARNLEKTEDYYNPSGKFIEAVKEMDAKAKLVLEGK
jgi:hypothetical protein